MQKHRVLILGGIFIALVAMVLSSFGSSAHAASSTYGPFVGHSPDGGSCHNFWADDSYNRLFTVDDSITKPSITTPAKINESFQNGTFSTRQGVSPGACDAPSSSLPNGNGAKVAADIPGTFTGFENIEVTSGKLNVNGCSPSLGGVDCSSSGGGTNFTAIERLVAALYGPPCGLKIASTLEVPCSSFAITTFSFNYIACTTGLGHWTDSNTNQNGDEVFTGDISGEDSTAVNANNLACPQPTPVPPTPTPVPPTPTPIVTPVPPGIPTLPNTGSDPRA